MLWSLLLALAGPPPADCTGPSLPMRTAPGLCVRVFAEQVGDVRHLTVHPTGQVVAGTLRSGGLVRFRDVNGDGVADSVIRFGPKLPATGVAWRAGYLYMAADKGVLRFRWPATAWAPVDTGTWIVPTLPNSDHEGAHNMKGIAVGNDGAVYVSVGSMTDNCQVDDREPKSPGTFPCAERETRAGIWRFAPTAASPWPGARFAAGLRNAEALTVDTVSGRVWATVQGRDFLNKTWGWTNERSADQPAEMLVQPSAGADYGWPYCQGEYAGNRTTLVKTPEYERIDSLDCARRTQPVSGFPGHWAPMQMALANPSLPAPFRSGMFIAFHGSRSRAPLPEQGHGLMFVPFAPNRMPGAARIVVLQADGALNGLRAAGVAVSSNGFIYVSDDEHGKMYRIEAASPR